VIWNRRPGRPFDDIPPDARPSPATQRFVSDQWYSWLEALQLLSGIVWINHPTANGLMENKIRQLWLASKIGFQTPTTIVSNDPDAAKGLQVQYGGRIIAKALYSPLIEEPEQDYFIFTNVISGEIDPGDDDAIGVSPIVFQEPLIPKVDYRVTVVGDTVIPVKIEAQNGTPVDLDWRAQKDGLQFYLCSLPKEIEELCRSYVRQSGLLFGAIDLVEHNNKFVFLEINPNGEWGWLQKPSGVPIAETLCDLMILYDS
jgi:glutathione synthase/RimK-type ligase-like ATP-grasp enzyme